MVVSGMTECTLGVSALGLPEGRPRTATLDNLLRDTNVIPEGGRLTWENACRCRPDKGAGPLVKPTQGWESRLCSPLCLIPPRTCGLAGVGCALEARKCLLPPSGGTSNL